MLVLSNNDIEQILSLEEILDAVEKAYQIYEDGTYYMPHRFHVDYGTKNLLYMPCFLEGVFGTKLLTIFPDNLEKGIPSLDGLMLLNDYETGSPACLMDGRTVTALRTGAVGGVAIRHTTPETAETVGIIGAGVQGYHQALYACKVRNLKRVSVYDTSPQASAAFVDRLRQEISPGVEVMACQNAEELVKASEIIITATPATAPVMPDNAELLRGKHFIGFGSYKPHMREFPDALYSLVDRVYIDADIALEESGDLIQPIDAGLLREDQLRRFSRALQTPGELEEARQQTTLVKSVGIAIFDVVTASLLYQKAQAKGIGYTL